MELPNWQEVEHKLSEFAAPTGAAECHGILCGLLCAPSDEPATLWLREALGRSPEEAPPPPFDALFRATLHGLDDADLGFEVLLPDDDTGSVSERTAALAEWCTGLIYGLGVGGLEQASLDADAKEFLADVGEIARADPAVAQAEEADEEALAEIVEYLRIGTLGLRVSARGHVGG